MEAQDPLTQLADIHLPETVSWWPLAPGWWIAALLLLALALCAAFKAWQGWKRRQRLQRALDELDAAWATFQENIHLEQTQGRVALELLNSIQNIMRRVALLYFPVEDIAPLSGQRWLDFLQQSDPSVDFTTVEGLGDSAYRERFEGDPEPAYQAARHWIRNRYLKSGDPV